MQHPCPSGWLRQERLQTVSSHIEEATFRQNLVGSKVHGFTETSIDINVERAHCGHTSKKRQTAATGRNQPLALLPSCPLLCLCVAVPPTAVPGTVSARPSPRVIVRASPPAVVDPSLLPRLSAPRRPPSPRCPSGTCNSQLALTLVSRN